MQFPLNIIVAIIISAMHIFISFNLKLTDKYKNKFRTYSVIVCLVFIIFLSVMSLYLRTSHLNEGIDILYNGLATLYVLLFLPLLVVLILLLINWIRKVDAFSLVIKYAALVAPISILVVTVILGFAPFILVFYGFAP